jgi:hypothetical protein
MSEHGTYPPQEEGYDNSTMTDEERSELIRRMRAEMREENSYNRLREKARDLLNTRNDIPGYHSAYVSVAALDALREELEK